MNAKYLVLALLVFSVVAVSSPVKGVQPVTVQVLQYVGATPGPIPAGTSFVIEYWADPTLVGAGAGEASAVVTTSQTGGTTLWSGGPDKISGGLDYDFYPPGITTPGTYWATVSVATGSFDYIGQKSFIVTGSSSVITDWTVLSVSLTPPSPNVNDPVTFNTVVTAVSSTGSFPQDFEADCFIDGVSCGSGAVTYPGPLGTPATVSTQTPWIATPGTHTVTWVISTIPIGLDPTKNDNTMSQTFTVGQQAQFDFSMSATPTQQSVAPGASTSFSLNVGLVSGTPQPVSLSLSGAPSGVSAAFSQSSGTPSFSSTLSISTASSIAPGTYTMTVTGSGGGVSHSVNVALVVTQAPDFQLSVTPPSQTVVQGQAGSFNVQVSAMNGFNSPVTLTVSGLPQGVSGAFSTPSGTPNFGSTLTLTLASDAATGSFTLTVTGSGGGTSHTSNVILVITPSSQPSSTSQTTQSSIISTQTSTSGAGDIMSMLQSNPLLIIGALIVLLLLAILATLARRKGGGTTAAPSTVPGTVFCRKCGTANPGTSQYCSKCGMVLGKPASQ